MKETAVKMLCGCYCRRPHWFLLRHSDGRVRFSQHESIVLSCLVSTVQAGGVMVWGRFQLSIV